MTRFAARTDRGNCQENEDTIAWFEDSGIWLVADGMGGHASGALCSQLVKETFMEAEAGLSLEQKIEDAHRRIVEVSTTEEQHTGMGSTIVALEIEPDCTHVAWVGDSRAYLWRDMLELLTRDHSVVEALRQTGRLTEQELREHPQRNVVLKTLGHGTAAPESLDVELSNGDWVLLCSDGLNDELTEAQIATVLSDATTPDEAVNGLVDAAIEMGGRDNVSAIVVEYQGRNQSCGGRTDRFALLAILLGSGIGLITAVFCYGGCGEGMLLKHLKTGTTFPIEGPLRIGRRPDQDIVLKARTASGVHAALLIEGQAVYLVDLESSNGTSVNGTRIAPKERIKLNSGDQIGFDVEVFEFSCGDDKAVQKTEVRKVHDATIVEPPRFTGAAETPPEPVSRPPPSASAGATGQNDRPAAPSDAAQDKPQSTNGSEESVSVSDPFPGAKKKKGTVILTPEQYEKYLDEIGRGTALAEDCPCLVVQTGGLKGQTFLLRMDQGNSQWNIGREDGWANILLSVDGVSSRHATISREGNRWKVVDQMSSNSTFVRNEAGDDEPEEKKWDPVNLRHLSNGDLIRFGPVVCLFETPKQISGGRSARRRHRGKKRVQRKQLFLIAVGSFVLSVTAVVLAYFLTR